MPAGSVDCAAERGGNCELTDPDNEVVTGNSVTILGPTNLASTVPHEASLMYAKNMVAFLLHVVREGKLAIDLEDEIVAGTLVTREAGCKPSRARKSSRGGGWASVSQALEVGLFIFVIASFLGYAVITRVPGCCTPH